MRSVHLLGLGVVVGLFAMGLVVAFASLSWNELVFPASAAPGAAPAAAPVAQASPDVKAGQAIFQQRCTSCHTIGGGKLVGPDLKGVTSQRPHDWLVSFITAPDKVIASGDPTATQLVKQYGIPMPNLGITSQQAGQLLAYIQFQSGGATPVPAGAQAAVTPGSAGTAVPSPAAAAATPAAGATSVPAATSAPGAASAAGDPAKGKVIFDQKCTTCHTIGGGKLVGPDLKGVTQLRPHSWLVQWIMAPDKMIASGDPTATQLLQQYTIPMPNLGLTQADAENVIAYLAQQSGGGGTAAPPAAAAPPPAATPTSAPAAAAATVQPTAAPAATSPAAPAAAAPTAAPSVAAFQPKGDANNGKTVFEQKCASCHSIGGGKLVGPDLKGVTSQRPQDWLVNFITAPDKVIASGDPTATQLVKEYGLPMPNLGISQSQAEDILTYIYQQSGGQAAAPPGAAPAAPQITPGDAATGRALFLGEKPLSGGGPACIACHNVSGIGIFRGGTWGLDLTNEQSKNGTQGIASILKSPPFPGMKEAFAGHPISDSEIADLAAFFIEVNKQQPSSTPGFVFPLVGVGAFLVMLAIALLAWIGRTPGVRKQLVGGAGR